MLQYILPPLLGAIIGYFTNYLAVKMLFRPRKAVYVFGRRLPFTPGAIPKEQSRIARAIGTIVAGNLVTEEGVTAQLLSDRTKGSVTDMVEHTLQQTIRQDFRAFVPEDSEYEAMKRSAADHLTREILKSIDEVDLQGMIQKQSSDMIRSKVEGTMLHLFLSDDRINGIAETISRETIERIRKYGEEFLHPVIMDKIGELEVHTGEQMLAKIGSDPDRTRRMIGEYYERLVRNAAHELMSSIDVAAMIEDKINAMDVVTLEKLVLSAMKKELNMIVNLGALIGLVLGALSLLVS